MRSSASKTKYSSRRGADLWPCHQDVRRECRRATDARVQNKIHPRYGAPHFRRSTLRQFSASAIGCAQERSTSGDPKLPQYSAGTKATSAPATYGWCFRTRCLKFIEQSTADADGPGRRLRKELGTSQPRGRSVGICRLIDRPGTSAISACPGSDPARTARGPPSRPLIGSIRLSRLPGTSDAATKVKMRSPCRLRIRC